TSSPGGCSGSPPSRVIRTPNSGSATTTGPDSGTTGRISRPGTNGGSRQPTRGTRARCIRWATSPNSGRASTSRATWPPPAGGWRRPGRPATRTQPMGSSPSPRRSPGRSRARRAAGPVGAPDRGGGRSLQNRDHRAAAAVDIDAPCISRLAMSTNPSPTTAKRPVGVVRILFPAFVVGLAAAVLLIAWQWPGTEVDSSTISMVKSLTVIVAGVLLLLWALRMPGWRKRYVWIVFLGGIGLSMVFVRFHSMWGKFLPIFVARDWVQDAFFGGSPDTLLERHRQAQGRAEGGADLTIKPGHWPGYRGANRDGVATGATIARDWSTSPPKEVWRQPVGGGYAAFSYANGFLVTIEQRRDQEVVVCYEAATGKEAWTTGSNSRFSESAGGD